MFEVESFCRGLNYGPPTIATGNRGIPEAGAVKSSRIHPPESGNEAYTIVTKRNEFIGIEGGQ